MKATIKIFLAFVLLLNLISCGDNKGKNVCISREAKILECRAVEASRYTFNTELMLQQQEEKCKRAFVTPGCYD